MAVVTVTKIQSDDSYRRGPEYHQSAVQETADAYADLMTIDVKNADRVGIAVQNTDGANSLDFKVLGSVDGSAYPAEVVAETAVAASSEVATAIVSTPCYQSLKIQIKATVGGNQGDAVGKVLVQW